MFHLLSFCFLFSSFFSILVTFNFDVAIVLDIMEGQWRGRAQKWPKCHSCGVKHRENKEPKKRHNVIRGKTALVPTHQLCTDAGFHNSQTLPREEKASEPKVGSKGIPKFVSCWKLQPVACKVNMEWKSGLWLIKDTSHSLGQNFSWLE